MYVTLLYLRHQSGTVLALEGKNKTFEGGKKKERPKTIYLHVFFSHYPETHPIVHPSCLICYSE